VPLPEEPLPGVYSVEPPREPPGVMSEVEESLEVLLLLFLPEELPLEDPPIELPLPEDPPIELPEVEPPPLEDLLPPVVLLVPLEELPLPEDPPSELPLLLLPEDPLPEEPPPGVYSVEPPNEPSGVMSEVEESLRVLLPLLLLPEDPLLEDPLPLED
jgi:hypothetical protein